MSHHLTKGNLQKPFSYNDPALAFHPRHFLFILSRLRRNYLEAFSVSICAELGMQAIKKSF